MPGQKPKKRSATDEKKRFYILGGTFLALALVIGGLLMFLGTRPEEKAIKSKITITDEEQNTLDSLGAEYVQAAGNWGMDSSLVKPTTILSLRNLVQSKSSSVDPYFQDRIEGYEAVASQYIAPWGPMVYSRDLYTAWRDDEALNSLSTFKVSNPVASTEPYGEFITIGAKDYKTAWTTVSFTSTQTNRVATADDVAWDGTFSVMEKSFQETVRLKMVEVQPGEWKVYDQQGPHNEFLLTTWRNVGEDYAETQFDFKPVGEVKGVKK